MQVKRFVAADMRRALELVRQEMGPDAVILSSQRNKDGVEILTTLEEPPKVPAEAQHMVPSVDHSTGFESPMASDNAWGDQAKINSAIEKQMEEQLQASQTARPAPAQTSVPRQAPVLNGQTSSRGLASGKTSQELADEIERARTRMLAARKAESGAPGEQSRGKASFSQSLAQAASDTAGNPIAPQTDARVEEPAREEENRRIADQVAQSKVVQAEQDQKLSALQSELAGMRQLLEEQLGRMSWGQMAAQSPVHASLWRRFNRLGLPADSAHKVLSQLTRQESVAEAWPEALATLSHQLPVAGKDIVDEGGIFAFVGPTGVGKTTTIGKLAARYVLNHGADKVAMVTTDTYRIAAHDQLRSLGRILNVTVRVVEDSHTLPEVLDSLKHCSLVLIDTAGFRHGDPLLTTQLEVLRAHAQVKSYLVMACNSQLQMMKASVEAFQRAGLSGCVLTKLDETASLGEAIGVVVDQQLPVVYTTDGQEIPQDIDVARAHQLVSKAVALTKSNTVDEQRLAAGVAANVAGSEGTARASAEHLY